MGESMWKHFHRYGVFAPQFADKLALIDNDVSLTTAFNEKFLLKLLKTVDIRSPKTGISVHFSYSLPMAMQIY